MQLHMLKGKIHRAVVTGSSLDYEGSLSVDPKLLDAANMLLGEKILVVDIDNGARFETYTMEGEPGEIRLNGAAARLGQVGDRVIVMCFAVMDEDEARAHTPAVVRVDGRNEIVAD